MKENESRKWLYNTLSSAGYNVGRDYAEFDSLMSNNEESRKWAFETATAAGYNVGRDYAEFDSLINPIADKSQYTFTEQQLRVGPPELNEYLGIAPQPLTEQDKEDMTAWAERQKNIAQRTEDNFNERRVNMEAYRDKTRLAYGHTAEGNKVYNPEAGQLEQTYITPLGNETTNKTLADMESAQYRQYLEETDMSLEGQLRRAHRKLAALQEQRKAAGSRAHEKAQKFANEKLNGTLGLTIVPSVYQSQVSTEKEINALDVAISETEELIGRLKREQERRAGTDVGFWRGVGSMKASDFDLGMGSLRKNLTKLHSDKLVGGNATEDERSAYNEMMAAQYLNEQAEGTYKDSWWYDMGVMGKDMLPFMLDFTIFKGTTSIPGVFAKGTSKLAIKTVGKEAAEKMAKEGFITYIKNNGARGLGQYAKNGLIKFVGTTADDLIIRAPLMTNTVQLAKTSADVIDRKLGDVVIKEDGTYDFKNNKTWGSAVWQGEANAVIENFSEMLGAHLPNLSLKSAGKLAEVIGAKRLSGVLAKADANGFAKVLYGTEALFEKMGVSGYFGEVTEEYYGQLWRTMLNLDDAYMQNPDGTRTNLLLTGKFHGDIWGGMALSMGVMQAGKFGVSGVTYANMKHNTKKADVYAAELLGKDIWEPLRETIDITTNEDMGAFAENVLRDNELTMRDKAAIMAYMERSMALRGYNLATIAQARGEGNETAQAMSAAYLEGYNIEASKMREVKSSYDALRLEVEDIVNSEVLAQLETLPVTSAVEMLAAEQWNDYRETIINYLTAKQRYEGMQQGVRDNIDDEIERNNAEIDKRTNKTDGNIYSVTLGGGLKGYVTGGTVITDSDGDIDIDATREANEGGYIYVNVDGVVKPKSVDDFVSLDGVESAADAKAVREAEINAALNAEYEALTAPVETQEATPASTEVAPAETAAAPVNNAPAVSEVAENAARVLGVLPEELEEVILDEQEGLERAARYNNIGDTDSADAIRAYVVERFGTPAVQPAQVNNAAAAEVGNNGAENIPAEQAPVLSPEQQRKAKRAEIAARIPTKGKNKLWTQAKAEDVAEYIATLTDDAAVQQATADRYIADIKEKQAKMDAIEALELNDDIAFWESVKGLLAPVETQSEEGATEQAPEVIPVPTAENEMQPVADVTEQPLSVESEEAGEPVGETEQLNQSKDNTEMGARLTNEVSKENKVLDPRNMSDEERAKRGDMLRNAPAVDVNEGVITSTKELSARKAAEKWWDENVPEPVFYDTEVGEVEIGRSSVESSLAHRYGQAKLDAITSLIDGFENAVYLGSMPDSTRHGGVVNHYFAYPINYKGKRCYVFCRAMQDANKNRLYVHEVFIADNIKKGDTLQTAASQPHGGIALYKDILANVLDVESTSVAEDRNSVSNSQENSVKSGENTQNRGEKDVIEEMREQNRVAEEREQRAGVPPRVSDYSTAINAEDTEAQKVWEDRFNDFLAKLTIDDLPTIDSTISSMQGNKEAIKSGDPGGYKENPNYRAFDYIEKALKKRKRELEKSSTNEEKSQEIEDNSTNGGESGSSEIPNNSTISQESEQVGDQVEDEKVLSESEYADVRSAEIMADNINLDDVEAYNMALDEYPKYIGDMIKSGKLSQIYKKATVGERIALNKMIQAAGYEISDVNTQEVKEESKKAESKFKVGDVVTATFGDGSVVSGAIEKIEDGKIKIRSNGRLYPVDESKIGKGVELQRGSLSLESDNPAFKAATEKTMQALEKTDVEVVMATEEQVKAMMGADFSRAAAPFYSNARKAVLDIKQEKATPEQWVAMLKKNGGLKAGEDAWVGLEAWLNNQQGTVAKQEILDYLTENSIQIEEVEYEDLGKSIDYELAAVEGNLERARRDLAYEEAQVPIAEKWLQDSQEEYDSFLSTANRLKTEYGENSPEYRNYIFYDSYTDVLANAKRALENAKSDVEYRRQQIAELEKAVKEKQNQKTRGINRTRLDYTTDGLDNKREIALVVPTIEPYNASDEIHFGDAGGGRAVAWVRFGETTDSEGKRVLVIDEIQSKRHQDGREKGYGRATSEDVKSALEAANAAQSEFDEYNAEMAKKYGSEYDWNIDATDAEIDKWQELYDKVAQLGQVYEDVAESNRKGIPSAPFEKNWHELAMKRMLRLAAEEGFDKVAWTTGEQQAERYNIGAVVNRIESNDTIDYDSKLGVDLVKQVVLFTRDGNAITLRLTPEGIVRASSQYNGHHINDIVGKELGNRIMTETDLVLKEQDLRIGGEGMKGFYDKMLPSFVQKYTKKWGAKVGEVTMPGLKKNNTMHSVDVTPEMRESVMQGQPMFLRISDGTVYGWTVNGKIFLTPEGINPNTPVHEYTHLWASAIEQRDPKMWRKIVEAMKQSPVWNEVMADEAYRDIWNDENRVASEVLSRLSGNENYRRTMQEAALRESDPTKKFGLIAAWGRVKRALADFWNAIKGLFSADNATPWEQFVNSAIGDFYKGVNPNVKNSPMERMTMGSRVDARMAQVASELEGRVLTTEQQAVADVFGGKADNLTINVKTKDGNERKVVMRQGNEANAGAKHSLYRHFGTGVGVITSDDIISIPSIITNGVRTEKKRGSTRLAEYKLTDVNGGEFTVLTEIKKGKEIFNDFYSNKKAPLSGTFNTQSAHTANNNALSADKGSDNSSNSQENDDILFRSVGGNSGYVGYSMSKRAAEAREEGRFPKTDFKKEYNMPQQTLDALVETGIIDNSEWHHTSKIGNRTTFYGWADETFAEMYAENKKEIDALVKEVNANIAELEKEEKDFLNSWRGYQYPESFDWDAYSRRARELEDLPYNERMDILHSEFPETAEKEKHDSRQREFSREIDNKKREQRKRIRDLFDNIGLYREGEGTYTDEEINFANDPVSKVLGKPRGTKKKQREFAERVENLAKKLHLDNVEVVTDASALEGKKQRAKGFYSKSTGKITIVIPNHSSAFDVEQTLLHEAVAHYGLRQLFGEHFDTFLDNVFKNADVSIRKRILELAQKKNWDLRTATEEYLASLAENTEFERTNASWWRQIKELFLNMLHKIGFEGFGGVTLTDSELRYILWRSYENLAEPGKLRSILGEVSDIAKQYELKVGNYAQSSIDASTAAKNDDLFRDGDSYSDAVSNEKESALSKIEAARKKRLDDIRLVGTSIEKMLDLMKARKEYDRTTVETLVKLANNILDMGLISELSRYEIKRLLAPIVRGVGQKNLTRRINEIVNALLDAQLAACEHLLDKQLKTKGSKITNKGVEVQGTLDAEGQQVLTAFKEGRLLDKDSLTQRLADALNRMGDDSSNVASVAAAEYQGLLLAQKYREDITDSVTEERELRVEIINARESKAAGEMSAKAFREFKLATEEAMLKNKLERVDAYLSFLGMLSGTMKESLERAKEFKKEEVERVREIQHNANSDMQGRTASYTANPKMEWFYNNPIVRFFMNPLATFDYMLRRFGDKSVKGEGYLWNRFMGGYIKANDEAWKGLYSSLQELDAKVSEVFGKKMKWADLFYKARKMPKALVTMWNGEKMEEYTITQGNMLYIYMVNKMEDGQMKLRKMGITESVVDELTKEIDPRLKDIADWIQDTFLKNKRNKYNEVYERMFGAPMAAIENYFPLVINSRSRGQEVDISEPGREETTPSTITGSIIKRRRNSLPLDVLNADAFEVVTEHLRKMEHWAAFAEYSRDLNVLLSYNRFKNQVLNMSTLRFGAGKELWNNFQKVASISAGAYTPVGGKSSFDKAAVNISKGVTAAKISFRIFTAFKQLLSTPAYLASANWWELVKSLFSMKESWNWAIKELPGFAERWQSRMAGNEKLKLSDADWGIWKSKFMQGVQKYGMAANAFIDAITVAFGANAIYNTAYKRYKDAGFSEEKAKEKALNEASVIYNETQQSSEGAYMSPMQMDRTAAANALTIYRNSSMGYQRKLMQSVYELKRMSTKGYKDEAIAFMTKQYLREGLEEEKVRELAEKEWNNSFVRNCANVAIFGFVMQFAWNLGAYLPYLIFGDDDDKKDEMVGDAALLALFGGWTEGLSGGNIISGALVSATEGDLSHFTTNTVPFISELEQIVKSKDAVKALEMAVNLLAQSGIGTNPQTISDAIVGIIDFAKAEDKTFEEATILFLRAINAPQSNIDQLILDRVEDSGTEIKEGARLAEYKMMKNYPYTIWFQTDEGYQERRGKYLKRFDELYKERIGAGVDNVEDINALIDAESDVREKTLLFNEQKKILGKDKTEDFKKLDAVEQMTEMLNFGSINYENYTRHSTAADGEDDFQVKSIESKLQKTYSQLNYLKEDARLNYYNEHKKEIDLYKRIRPLIRVISKCKKNMDVNPENSEKWMQIIRRKRQEIINIYGNE